MNGKKPQDKDIPLQPKSFQGTVYNSRRIIKSLKAKADARRTLGERGADFVTRTFGSMWFLLLNMAWFVIWIIINMNWVPSIPAFDPFPFGLLTMIVSLEAIVLSVFVLISQNRVSKVDDLREEIDLQMDIITEQEVTKLMHMVAVLMEKEGIDISKDRVLASMLRPTDLNTIERALERQIIND